MYIVVSKWETAPGASDEFRTGAGRQMRDWLRAQPAVEFVNEFETEDGNAVAVVGYKDQASYKKLILDDGSEFEKKAAEMNLAKMGKWLWSERGEAVE